VVEFGLAQLLMNDAGITAICNSRVYGLIIPDEATYPAISYQIISDTPDATMNGPSSWEQKRVQIDCWAVDYVTAKNLQAAVRTAINGFKGAMPNGTFAFSIFKDNELDFYEDVPRLCRATTDYMVQFNPNT
jgi:hypothetical protein